MEERQLRLFEDFCLPVYGGLVTALEYVPYERLIQKRRFLPKKTGIWRNIWKNYRKKVYKSLQMMVK